MSDVVGMGVVGAGAIGLRCALSHLSLPDVQDRVRLAAVCDPVPGRAEQAARKYGVPAWYLTMEELLNDPQVNAVTLGTPIGLHYDQGMAAIRAGKHVHFNKTMAVKAADCTEMIDLAQQRDVWLVASPGMMLHPASRRIRRRLLKGDAGQLIWAIAGTAPDTYHINEEYRQGDDVLSNVDPTWYFRKPGGGPLWDTTVYPLHTLTGLLGPAKRITALSGMALAERSWRDKTIACDMDDNTFILLDFGNALFAVLYGTVVGSVTQGFNPTLFGTAGMVQGTQFCGEEMSRDGDHQPHVTGPHAEMDESHVFEDLMQLVDWIREGTPSVASAEHARHVVEIFEAAYRVAKSGMAETLTTSFDPLTAEELDAAESLS